MAKAEKFSGEIANAYGRPLHELDVKEGASKLAKGTILKYDAEYEALESYAEAKDKNELPTEKEVVDFLNAKRKANARQKAMQVSLDAAGIVKPTLENDPQLQLASMYKVLIASKKSHEEARAIASATLGIEWAAE